MKRKLSLLVFTSFMLGYSAVSLAGLFDAWADEDEEVAITAMQNSISKPKSQEASVTPAQNYISQEHKIVENYSLQNNSQSVPVQNYNYAEGYNNDNSIQTYSYSNENTLSYANGSPSETVEPEIVKQEPIKVKFVVNTYRDPRNTRNAILDSDTLHSEGVIRDKEVYNSIDKWKRGQVNVFWENYRGNNVRIEVLRNNKDVKEIRLKFVQSHNISADPDDSISNILNIVSNQVMKRICGRTVKQTIMLYEKPSLELERETVADGYKVMAKGSSLKEYGFRCVY